MSELHDRVTRNLRVLMAVRGMDGYAPLAETLDIDKAAVSNKMRGRRQWSLADIEKIAHLFQIEPSSLVGDGRDLLDPNPLRATGTGGTRGDTLVYVPGGHPCTVIPFPQAESRSTRILPGLADIIPLQRGHTNPSLPVAI